MITGDPTPGAIVWANVWHPFEDPRSRGKIRPVLLVEREEGHWLVVGLTTVSIFRSGKARVPVPNPGALGLRKPGYLWGDRLTKVSAIDIGDVIGRCDAEMAEAVIGHVHLTTRQRVALRLATNMSQPES